MRILSCQTTKARLVIKVLEAQGLIKAIQGKGKYILNVTGGAGEEYGI
jgi:DNA-binding GntR family transcriptional regulator